MIEKDDLSRKQLGLKTMTLKELHRIRKIREAVKPETIWLPRLPGDKREDAGRIDMGEDDSRDHSRERKNDTKRTKRYILHVYFRRQLGTDLTESKLHFLSI